MQTFYAYQARFVIIGLTNLADELELAELPEWHTIAHAATCLEHLLHDEQPADLAEVTASLKALNIPNPGYRTLGKFTFLLVDLTIALLDGIRLGLLEIKPKIQRPIWIGIDRAAPGTEQTITLKGRTMRKHGPLDGPQLREKVMNTEKIDFPLPAWAIARTSHLTSVGAQLRTKDGRACGNAVTVEFPIESRGLILAKVITDAGTEMLLTENELSELFYQPEYVMDISTAPGMIVRNFERKS